MVAVKKFLMGLLALLTMTLVASAQTTATNMVSLVSDNVENARDVMVPLGIGLTVLFVGIAVILKIYRKTVK